MTCAEAEPLLELAGLGAQGPDPAAALTAHLQACRSCQAALRDVERLVGLLCLEVPQVSPPPRLRERLLAEVHRDASQGRRQPISDG